MDKCVKIAALYVASLKALALIQQQEHWLAKGNNFYGNHLLFERLYNATLVNIDLAAEKFIGLFGEACLDYKLQTTLLNRVLSNYNNLSSSPGQMTLSAVKDFLKLSQEANDCFKTDNKLSLGLADMIGEIASKSEEYVYLLQQMLKKDTK